MIELKNVSFGYESTKTVKNISLRFKDGDFVALIGTNGAGKSTILKLIRGLIKPSSGKILIDGQDIAKIRISRLAGKIGYLFQNPDRQLCKNTVSEELMFSLKYSVDDTSLHKKLCDETLERFLFDGSEEIVMLSRGERQRAALVSAIVAKPSVLLLDEPTTGLDYGECTAIMQLIKSMNESGVTVIMICHDMEIVLDYAKRAVIVDSGEILKTGSVKDVFYSVDENSAGSIIAPQIIRLAKRFGDTFGRPVSCDEFLKSLCNIRGGKTV